MESCDEHSRRSPRIHFLRHGQTAWLLSGQHTGRTDLSLTAYGEARGLGDRLGDVNFTRAFTSPLLRARRTSEVAGLGDGAAIEPDAVEWDYGDYEERRPEEIRKQRPDWKLSDGCPGGETPLQILEGADLLIARLRAMDENTAVFAKSRFGRVLGAR